MGKASDALLKLGRFFTRWEESRRRSGGLSSGRSGWRCLLSRSVEPRQGGAVHPWCELHRFLLVEDLRPRRDHHLGGSADRLSVRRSGSTRVRAPRLPAGCRLLVVHLLPHPSQVSVRARRSAGDVSGSQAATEAIRSWPGPTWSAIRNVGVAITRPAARADWYACPGPKPWR